MPASWPRSSASACARPRSRGATARSAGLAVRREEGVGARRWRSGTRGAIRVRARERTRRRPRGGARPARRRRHGRAPDPVRARAGSGGDGGGRPAARSGAGSACCRRPSRAMRRVTAFAFRLRTTERRVVSPAASRGVRGRRLISLEGRFTAASRAGRRAARLRVSRSRLGRRRPTSCAPRSGRRRRAARDDRSPAPEGELDVVLADGCASVLFHEILSHPLEAGADASPLDALAGARIAVAELEVSDDARRLDLFGGYELDDEGTTPRSVRLAHAGVLAGRLTDRAPRRAAGSTGHGRRAGPAEPPLPRGSNVVVAAGSATPEEMVRRLQAAGSGSRSFAAARSISPRGSFRLHFPRARRVRRGALADELGPGWIAGQFLPTLRHIEPALGRRAHVYRALGWCAREGQVVPVGGAAPDILIRRLVRQGRAVTARRPEGVELQREGAGERGSSTESPPTLGSSRARARCGGASGGTRRAGPRAGGRTDACGSPRPPARTSSRPRSTRRPGFRRIPSSPRTGLAMPRPFETRRRPRNRRISSNRSPARSRRPPGARRTFPASP